MKEKDKGKDNVLVKRIILIILIVGIATAIYSVYRTYKYSSPVAICKMPLLTTEMYSEEDDTSYNFSTNVAFGIDKSLTGKYDEKAVEAVTRQTISSLDYDKLCEPDGTEYLKANVYANVQAQFPELINENFDVYIYGYNDGKIGGYLPGLVEEDNVNSGDARTKQLEEMFGN